MQKPYQFPGMGADSATRQCTPFPHFPLVVALRESAT